MKYRARTLLIALVLFLSSVPAFQAWGDDGHKIVCAIAQKLLDDKDRKEVERLSKLYRTPSGGSYKHFTEGCTFPDEARRQANHKPDPVPGWERFKTYEHWHFLNVPRTTKTISTNACGNDCVLHGIQTHFERLSNHNLSDKDRAEALLFLGHWLGDIHQPLHISYRDDLGGNEIKPIKGIYVSDHLHSVWDTGILTHARGTDDWWTYAGKLKDGIKPDMQTSWLAAMPLQWAQESYDITTKPGVKYCNWVGNQCQSIPGGRNLTSDYQKDFQAGVETRLQMAGVRLASLIRKALHP